jgi:hypothetical protein
MGEIMVLQVWTCLNVNSSAHEQEQIETYSTARAIWAKLWSSWWNSTSIAHKITCLNSRPHDCICWLLLKTATVKAYKSALSLQGLVFCKTAWSFQDCFLHVLYMILSEFHTTYLLDFWLSIFLSPEFQIKFDCVWTCLNMSDKYLIMSNHVWSTIGRHTTKFDQIVWSCLIMSNHVWSCLIMSDRVFWSCLIMFDQLSAEIRASLIKGFPRTTTTTKQNVDPAVYYVYSRVKSSNFR